MANEGQVRVDFNYSVEHGVGPHGASSADLNELKAQLVDATATLLAKHAAGGLAFVDLPKDTAARDAAKALAAELRAEFDTLVVLGIGGSSLGAKALISSLVHPFHNLRPASQRSGMRVFFPDNSDPATFSSLLEILELPKTAFAVVTKSGGTAETISQLSIVRNLLQGQLGAEAVRRQIVAITDPEQGPLRKLAQAEGWRTLAIPPGVGGRFSVLTACGLLPAACAGIDVDAVLEGAASVAGRSFGPGTETFWETPAGALGGMTYIMNTSKHRTINVFMPYADALRETGAWLVQLWAESLGKRRGEEFVGPTPVGAVGATDQHSLLQLLMQGPHDKFVIFVKVEKTQGDVAIPAAYPDEPAASYLQNIMLSKLIDSEQTGTAAALVQNGRPSATILLPEISPFQVGALLMMLELSTMVMGHLHGINTFDQPGVELSKRYTSALLGRKGYEEAAKELAALPEHIPLMVLG
jgi:glucose-6-phosphate isomerase